MVFLLAHRKACFCTFVRTSFYSSPLAESIRHLQLDHAFFNDFPDFWDASQRARVQKKTLVNRPACASSISNTAITTIQHPLLDSHRGRSINML